MSTNIIIAICVAVFSLVGSYLGLKYFKPVPKRPWLVTFFLNLIAIILIGISILVHYLVLTDATMLIVYITVSAVLPFCAMWTWFMFQPLSTKTHERREMARKAMKENKEKRLAEKQERKSGR